MSTCDYKHLLLAVDFEPESEPVIARAESLRGLCGARLSLLHVLEHVPPAMEYMPLGLGGEVAVPSDLALEEELISVARKQMETLGERLGVAPPDRLVQVGSAGAVIDDVAREIAADLIIIGSRGRHGLLGLFGSTAKSVLRSAACDVLCVRIAETKPG
jgi:universal stress protein A